MVLKRLIPCMLIKNGGLVITEKFKTSKYVGDPVNAIKIFNDKEADEIVILDITASKLDKEPNFELLKRIAQEAFMPLTYGGGIKSLEHIYQILYTGYEKVALNFVALNNPDFIKLAVEKYGASTIVGCIDVKKNLFGQYRVYDHVNNSILRTNPIDYFNNLQELGVGEILINSVDRDGLRTGYDLYLIEDIMKHSKVSTICLGGAGTYSDIEDALKLNVDGAAAGSLFSLYGKHKAALITYNRSEVENYLENNFKEGE